MPFGFLFFVCLGGQTYTTSESEFLLPLSRVIVTTKASKQGELEEGGGGILKQRGKVESAP